MKLAICVLAVVMVAGCAPQRSLTVYTNPPGAALYWQGDTTTYTSPATVRWNLDPAYLDANGCLRVQSFTTLWSSGARIDAGEPLRLCHEHSTLTIERPNVPGLEHDLRMAELAAERALLSEIQRLEGQAAMAEGVEDLAEGIACQISGGCSTGRQRYPDEVRTVCRSDTVGNTYCTSRAR